MLRWSRLVPMPLLACVAFVTAAPASAQFVESRVRAYSLDDHAPLLQRNEDCDPLPPQDPEDPSDVECPCDVFGGGFAADEKCIDGDLFEFSLVPGERIAAGSFACDVDSCFFPGDPPDHGLGVAESDMGLNFVHAFSENWLLVPAEDYFVDDAGGAFSQWNDDLSFTTAVPDLVASTLRTTFRVRGSWQDRACFTVYAGTYTVPATPGGGSDFVSFANRGTFPGATLCLGVLGGPPPGFTDYDAEDGAIDLAIPIEIPIAVPSTVRVFGQLKAWANGDDSFVTGPNGGLEMTIERIEVPLGVNVASAAGALASYNVPEPTAATCAALAFAALLALRKR